MQIQKIFLASSEELKEDRQEFEIFINRKNKDLVGRDVFLELIVWEDFLDAVSQTRLQDEYNKSIRECDIFIMLFFTKVGAYTEEEFETAFGQFKATNKPLIYTYFKDAQVSIGSADENDLMSLFAFKKKLATLGHFLSVYTSIADLKFKFDQQLDKLIANGSITLNTKQDVQSGPSAQTQPPVMPYLAYGSWTLRHAIDESGLDWSNSVLKFTSQQPVPEGLQLRGSFTWRLNNELVGTEEVVGYYLAQIRQLTFEGQSVSEPERLAVGSYSAFLSADERELTDGRWGSTVQMRDAGTPGRWEASR